MTANATSVLEDEESRSVTLGIQCVLGLARQTLGPDAPPHVMREAALTCRDALMTPVKPLRGQRRRDERRRKKDRVWLMLGEAYIATRHHAEGKTRPEAAAQMGLTPRQLRTREQLLQDAIDYFEMLSVLRPRRRSRPADSRASDAELGISPYLCALQEAAPKVPTMTGNATPLAADLSIERILGIRGIRCLAALAHDAMPDATLGEIAIAVSDCFDSLLSPVEIRGERRRTDGRGRLQWPHRGRLKWPHFTSVVVGVDVD